MRTFFAAVLMVLSLGWAVQVCWAADARPVPLARAHSHNDYEHARPLLDALDAGFCSVEADIWCIDGQLLVAHDRDKVSPQRTLEKLYLAPLLERARKYNGRIYPDGPVFYLLIDFKDNMRRTYDRLRDVLKQYEEMLTVFTPDSTEQKAVTVIISGNRPIRTMAAESRRLAGVDGRPPDIEKDYSPHVMPWISGSWGSVFSWKGEGPILEEEQQKLRSMVEQVHANGQMIRFWALPWPQVSWPLLYEAGVDFINIDDLEAGKAFMLERMK